MDTELYQKLINKASESSPELRTNEFMAKLKLLNELMSIINDDEDYVRCLNDMIKLVSDMDNKKIVDCFQICAELIEIRSLA